MDVGYTILLCTTLLALNGDTITCDGIAMRILGDERPLTSKIEAPRTSKARCLAEAKLGAAAQARLSQLLSEATSIEDSGVRDAGARPLVRVRLADGRSAGSVLISEGLAGVRTLTYVPQWCK